MTHISNAVLSAVFVGVIFFSVLMFQDKFMLNFVFTCTQGFVCCECISVFPFTPGLFKHPL